MITIREPVHSDAAALSEVLCSSITLLCHADHRNEPDLIAKWTANKTPQDMTRWLQNPRLTLLFAERDGRAAGVGGVSEDGTVLLNYVSPDHRFCGVSKLILNHCEATFAEMGITRAMLHSTNTAHRFYRAAGWADCGEPDTLFGIEGFPMDKHLSRPD